MSDVAVAGAGLTGCLLAVRLARAGHDISLFDRRHDLRVRDDDAGRSINLALSTRGLDALNRVGLEQIVLEQAIDMPGRMIHDAHGKTTFQPYGTEAHHKLHSVNRDELNIALLDAADATPGVTTYFEHRIRDLSVRSGDLIVEHGAETRTSNFDVIYGADGAYSAVRGRLQRIGRVDFSQEFLGHGYKEIAIPAGPNGPLLDPNALHIWPRGSHMMIALPNPDGSFTGTLFWPFSGSPGFETVVSEADVAGVFRSQFPDVLALIPDLAAQYVANTTSSLVTMRSGPWHHEGRVMLIGDAAHAVVPFLGQGANAALEDVTVLMDLYDQHGHDAHETVFDAFYLERKADVDALANLAIEHYDEMRTDVSSRWFLLGKSLERALTSAMPARFVPLYTMISFSRTPYAEAEARANQQRDRLRIAASLIGLLLVAAVVAAIVLATS